VTTTSDPDANVDIGELVGAEDEDGLVELCPENLRGKQLERLAVNLDQALALHTARNGCDIVSDTTNFLLVQNKNYIPVAFFFLPKT